MLKVFPYLLLLFILVPSFAIADENEPKGIVWDEEQKGYYPVLFSSEEGLYKSSTGDNELNEILLDILAYLKIGSTLRTITADIGDGPEILPIVVLYDAEGNLSQAYLIIEDANTGNDALKRVLILDEKLQIENAEIVKRRDTESILVSVTQENSDIPKVGGIMALTGTTVGTLLLLDSAGNIIEATMIAGSNGGVFIINEDKYELPGGAKIYYKEGILSNLDFSRVSEEQANDGLKYYASTSGRFSEPVTIIGADKITEQDGVLKVTGMNAQVIGRNGESIQLIDGTILYKSNDDFYINPETVVALNHQESTINMESGPEKGIWITGCSKDLSSDLSINRVDLCNEKVFGQTKGDASFRLTQGDSTGKSMAYTFTSDEGTFNWDTEGNTIDVTGSVVEDNCNLRMQYIDGKVTSPSSYYGTACLETTTSYGLYEITNHYDPDTKQIQTNIKKIAPITNNVVSFANSPEQSKRDTTDLNSPDVKTTLPPGIYPSEPSCENNWDDFGDLIIYKYTCTGELNVVMSDGSIERVSVNPSYLSSGLLTTVSKTPEGEDIMLGRGQEEAITTARKALNDLRDDVLREIYVEAIIDGELTLAEIPEHDSEQVKEFLFFNCIDSDTYNWVCSEELYRSYSEREGNELLKEYKKIKKYGERL